ncbi:hypothetical protein BJ912DRAFT_935984 [Pholiota molesta]|nr:hypothetical protein BJ912DRAFT_935984 [Pholiota molesta]
MDKAPRSSICSASSHPNTSYNHVASRVDELRNGVIRRSCTVAHKQEQEQVVNTHNSVSVLLLAIQPAVAHFARWSQNAQGRQVQFHLFSPYPKAKPKQVYNAQTRHKKQKIDFRDNPHHVVTSVIGLRLRAADCLWIDNVGPSTSDPHSIPQLVPYIMDAFLHQLAINIARFVLRNECDVCGKGSFTVALGPDDESAPTYRVDVWNCSGSGALRHLMVEEVEAASVYKSRKRMGLLLEDHEDVLQELLLHPRTTDVEFQTRRTNSEQMTTIEAEWNAERPVLKSCRYYPPATALGIEDPPSGGWIPLCDETLAPEHRPRAFVQWLAQHFPHPELDKDCHKLVYKVNAPGNAPTFTGFTAGPVADRHFQPAHRAAHRRGGAMDYRAGGVAAAGGGREDEVQIIPGWFTSTYRLGGQQISNKEFREQSHHLIEICAESHPFGSTSIPHAAAATEPTCPLVHGPHSALRIRAGIQTHALRIPHLFPELDGFGLSTCQCAPPQVETTASRALLPRLVGAVQTTSVLHPIAVLVAITMPLNLILPQFIGVPGIKQMLQEVLVHLILPQLIGIPGKKQMLQEVPAIGDPCIKLEKRGSV